jgi:MerR family transcriptional regulator, Zn(II)-responsive regulator of zntA
LPANPAFRRRRSATTRLRGRNNYRRYDHTDVERLRFIAGARRIGCSLDELRKILAVQQADRAPCAQLLGVLSQRIASIDHLVRELFETRNTLDALRHAGQALPQDDPLAPDCICSLVRSYHVLGRLPPPPEDDTHD